MDGFHRARWLRGRAGPFLRVFPAAEGRAGPRFRDSTRRRKALPEGALPPALAGAVSLGLAGGAVLALGHLAARLPAALPTHRSLHDQPMPRVGGFAIWAGFLPVALACPPAAGIATAAWLAAWAAVAAVSLVDDWRGVRPLYRLVVHAIAALGVAAAIAGSAGAFFPWVVEVLLFGLVITWSANLFNFMDGSD